VAASLLWGLKGDAGQRALIGWSMRWDAAREVSGTDWMTPLLTLMLVDPYHAVRYQGMHAMRKQAEGSSLKYDYVEDEGKRGAAAKIALDSWKRKSGRRPSAARPELLLGAGSVLLEDIVNRMLAERDNREVILNE
jgi:hypothetical protein